MHPHQRLLETAAVATERAEAAQVEEPLAQVVAGAVLPGVLSVRVVPGVVWVTEAPWPPVAGVKAAWQPRLAWTPPSRLEGR
jgi:hypothetical protein